MMKGPAEGPKEGIRAMVTTLKELSVAPAVAAQKLTKHFGLHPDAAEEKVAQYWNLPVKEESDS